MGTYQGCSSTDEQAPPPESRMSLLLLTPNSTAFDSVSAAVLPYCCCISLLLAAAAIACEAGEAGSGSGRRPVFGAERHPSMHIAAQITSATSLSMVGPAAMAAAVPSSGGSNGGNADLPSILEVDVSSSGDVGADGGPVSVRAYKVEIEEHH